MRTGIIGDNSEEYIDHLIDIWNRGDCAILIDKQMPFEQACRLLVNSNATFCFIEHTYYVDTVARKYPEIIFQIYSSGEKKATLLSWQISNKFKDNYSDDEAVILFSSGTTGKQKGVILSFRAIHTNADAIQEYMNISGNHVISIVKALSHASTLVGELLVALKQKAKIVLFPTLVPPRYIMWVVEHFQVNIMCVNPSILLLLSQELDRRQYSIKSLQVIYTSGSYLHNSTLELAKRAFDETQIYNVYGLTEAGPRVCAQRKNCCHDNSVGKPIPNVRIVLVDDNGERVGRGKRGMIYVMSPSLFEGYAFGEKTKSDYSKWLNTGDMGYFDDWGELHVIGRFDDSFDINSHIVYPEEVEDIIIRNLNIDDCVVEKRRYPLEERLVCYYCSKAPILPNGITALKDALLPYEIPAEFIYTKSIAYNSNGKKVRNYFRANDDYGR